MKTRAEQSRGLCAKVWASPQPPAPSPTKKLKTAGLAEMSQGVCPCARPPRLAPELASEAPWSWDQLSFPPLQGGIPAPRRNWIGARPGRPSQSLPVVLRVHVCMHACVHMSMHVCACIYVCICVCICVHVCATQLSQEFSFRKDGVGKTI